MIRLEKEFLELLPLTADSSGFDKVFVPIKHDFSLNLPNENQLEIYHLRTENRKFVYSELTDFCIGNLIQYVFDRNVIKNAKTPADIQRLFNKGSKKFREIKKMMIREQEGNLESYYFIYFLKLD